jgi:hypothetical protein
VILGVQLHERHVARMTGAADTESAHSPQKVRKMSTEHQRAPTPANGET